MRQLLMTVMLIIVATLLYTFTVGGPGGAKEIVKQRADHVNESIERMNP